MFYCLNNCFYNFCSGPTSNAAVLNVWVVIVHKMVVEECVKKSGPGLLSRNKDTGLAVVFQLFSLSL